MLDITKEESEGKKKREKTIDKNRSVDELPLEKKKKETDVSLFRKSCGVTETIKQILDLNINSTVGELPAFVSSVEK